MPDPRLDAVGRVLLALCAVSALAAAVGGLSELGDTPDAWLVTQFWRASGLVVFAGLWALLAWAPREFPGLWELVVLHKALVAGYALTQDVPDAGSTVAVDGALVAVTLVAWVLCRGWLSWRRTPPAGSAG